MITMIYNFYNLSSNYLQSHLNSCIPQIPENLVKEVTKGFAYSFVISLLFSKGDVLKGLTGGALAAVATLVYGLALAAMSNKDIQDKKYYNKSLRGDFEVRHIAFFAVWGGTLYLGNKLGFRTNILVSFSTTISPANIFPYEVPLMGIAVV